jgi:hypothetical protein
MSEEHCEVLTSSARRCFTNGTESGDCKNYCDDEMPDLIRWIRDYFNYNYKKSDAKYCLFIKYIFMTEDYKINEDEFKKKEFDNLMQIFVKLNLLESDLNKLENDLNNLDKSNAHKNSLNIPLFEKSKIDEKIQNKKAEIEFNLKVFLNLRDVLFTQYDEYLSDMLYSFKDNCKIVTCTDAFIDMLIWNINEIDGLKELIKFETKDEVLRVVDSKLNQSPSIYIEEKYYDWFLDTIISNTSDLKINFLATKYKELNYDYLIESTKENTILNKEFDKIIKRKLRNIRHALINDTCRNQFINKSMRDKAYAEVNPSVADYFS